MAQIIITDEQLASLKDEIKKELMNQGLGNSYTPSKKSPWDEIRESIFQEVDIDIHSQWQIVNAVSAIVRHTFKLRAVRALSDENAFEAKQIVESVISMINRKSKQEVI